MKVGALIEPRWPGAADFAIAAQRIGVSSLWVPEVWGYDALTGLAYLAALGHRRIARVAGPAHFVHTRERGEAFTAAAAELGLDGVPCVYTDYSGEDGARATRRLLSGSSRPTAIVYDNDVMAVAALSVTQEMGVPVPGELSLVAWDDSELCRLVHPALTAVSRRVMEYGERAAAALLSLIDGTTVPDLQLQPPALPQQVVQCRIEHGKVTDHVVGGEIESRRKPEFAQHRPG